LFGILAALDEEEDDVIMPPPSVPLKKLNKVEKKDKGKGKEIEPTTNRVEEMWVDKFAPTSRVRSSSLCLLLSSS